MGLFDLFKGKTGSDKAASAQPAVDKNVARLGRVAGDKHAQNYDRIEAIEALARTPSAESAEALLRRFTFHIDPSITDQEEKDAALRGILAAGEAAIEPIRAFSARAASLTWPLKILKELVPADRYVDELVSLLNRFDTEYARNTDPKQQLIAELEHHKTPTARGAVVRFLEDVNEPIRFCATGTLFAQDDDASIVPLVKMLVAEESVRVKNRVAEGFVRRAAGPFRAELRAEVKAALTAALCLGCGRSHQEALIRLSPAHTKASGPADSSREAAGNSAPLEGAGYSELFSEDGKKKPRLTLSIWLNLNSRSASGSCCPGTSGSARRRGCRSRPCSTRREGRATRRRGS